MPVRTSPYLQEIVGVKEEAQVGCQTDQFKLMESDECTFCEYKPLKSGIDAQTQIYEGEVSGLSGIMTRTAQIYDRDTSGFSGIVTQTDTDL